MSNLLLSFLSGVGVTLVGALVVHLLQCSEAKKRRINEVQTDIYFKMLDLSQEYFWVASSEIHRKEVAAKRKSKISDLAWQISDLVRQEDEVQFAEEILRVLMSNEYSSATDRHRAMASLLEKLGKVINPKFQKISKELSDSNLLRLGSGDRSATQSTTPGFME
ncbi:hypothetical protein [Marinobacter sp. CHS3-4]|uniref:hypothetical protein n=1 Tax=Marinobacter sp. CHS3-4 TaxID=3045174 RepID=UPI0024B5960B|nr:hypothetical protein [Marinobacter sp. CHS3-4]MDI9243601.1 hypothetical protein [Marinobacter sp. CHS3-4]